MLARALDRWVLPLAVGPQKITFWPSAMKSQVASLRKRSRSRLGDSSQQKDSKVAVGRIHLAFSAPSGNSCILLLVMVFLSNLCSQCETNDLARPQSGALCTGLCRYL